MKDFPLTLTRVSQNKIITLLFFSVKYLQYSMGSLGRQTFQGLKRKPKFFIMVYLMWVGYKSTMDCAELKISCYNSISPKQRRTARQWNYWLITINETINLARGC